MSRAIGIIALAGTLACSSACLDDRLPDEETPSMTTFIALQRDFDSLESWQRFELGSGALDGHPTGPRVVFASQLPPSGSAVFPVGTILAKAIESGAPTEWVIHAMVKRGGDYNARGARGWEWFELKLTESRAPVIVWRGESPPSGEGYGCVAGACDEAPDCNQCHAAARNNDFVQSDVLRLSGL